jgi:hypothetical protein
MMKKFFLPLLLALSLIGSSVAAAAEPNEADKVLSREVYGKYINQTLFIGFGDAKFQQIWLYGDGTFADYDNANPPAEMHAPKDVKWTGSSWWAEGKSNDWSLCLKNPEGKTRCHKVEPDHRPGDHWFGPEGDMVLMSGLVWSFPHAVTPPRPNPATLDPATKAENIPSEAAKAESRKIYANYVGNTLVCSFNGQGGCMLWLFANGTFLVHTPPGPASEAVNEPVSQRVGQSWWATGTETDRKLCLLHIIPPGGNQQYLVCYHLNPNHQVGDVWLEADDTMALLNGRN